MPTFLTKQAALDYAKGPGSATIGAPSATASPARQAAVSAVGGDAAQKNVAVFGRMLKQKYPMYAKADDMELGRRMLDKHPQYENKVIRGEGLVDPNETTALEKVKGFGAAAATFPAAIPSILGKAQQYASVAAAAPFALVSGVQGLAKSDELSQVSKNAQSTTSAKIAKGILDYGKFAANLGEEQSQNAGEYGALYSLAGEKPTGPGLSSALLPEDANAAKRENMKKEMAAGREVVASSFVPLPGVQRAGEVAAGLAKPAVKKFVMTTGLPVSQVAEKLLGKTLSATAGGSLAGAEAAAISGQSPVEGAKYGAAFGLIPPTLSASKLGLRGLGVAANAVKAAPGQALEAVKGKLAGFGEKEVPFSANPITGENATVNELRRHAAGMDERMVPVLQDTHPAELEEKLKAANAAVTGKSDYTPYHAGADKANKAIEQLEAKIEQEVSRREEMMKPVANQPFVSGGGTRGVGSEGLRSKVEKVLNEMGIKTDSKGRLKPVRGRGSMLTEKGFSKDLKVLSDTLDDALKEGTIGEKRDTVKHLQDKLYENGVRTVSPKTEAAVKRIEGLLNDELKAQLPSEYRDIQSQLSDLIDTRNKAEKAFSPTSWGGDGVAPSNRGQMAMKRFAVGTTTDADVGFVADKIKQLTGIDLRKEAMLNHFAMTAAGDIRAGTLFKEIKDAKSGVLNFLFRKALNAEPVEIARDITQKAAKPVMKAENEAMTKKLNK